jgi:hypothetical protein
MSTAKVDYDKAVYEQQIASGKSHEYALAYAAKIGEGEVFARHFASIRYGARILFVCLNPPKGCARTAGVSNLAGTL